MGALQLKVHALLLFIVAVTGNQSTDINSLLKAYCPAFNHCETDGVKSACLKCSCDSNCDQKGNCCPAGFETPKESNSDLYQNPKPNHTFACVVPRSNTDYRGEPGREVNKALGLYMVSSCKEGQTDERCTSANVEVLEEKLPQTSRTTGLIYRNIYCATCNNETDITPWKPYITCSDYVLVKADVLLFPSSVEKIYKEAVSSEDVACGVEFRQPDGFDSSHDMCYADELVSTCGSSNESIAKACRDISLPYFYKEDNKTTAYANVFCYLCQNNTKAFNNEFDETLAIPLIKNTFIAELNYDNVKTENLSVLLEKDYEELARKLSSSTITCDKSQVFDPYTEGCRNWYCPTDSIAIDGVCVSVFKKIEKATYQVRLSILLEEESDKYFLSNDSYNITSELLFIMFGNGSIAEANIVLIAVNETGMSLFAVVLMQISTVVDGVSTLLIDHFNRTYTVPMKTNQTLQLHVKLATGVMMEMIHFPLWNVQIIDTTAQKALTIVFVVEDVAKIYEYPVIEKNAYCRQIVLDKYEYIDLVGALIIRKTSIMLQDGEFIRIPSSRNIRVCYHDYLRLADAETTHKDKPMFKNTQAIVSLVCTSMSISCLILTVATYTIFSELRSVPGKNNILLAVHLLIAQSLFQFTFTENGQADLCTMFGMFTHFFWLTAIFWMSACTMHMFRTFVTKRSFRSKRALDPQVCCYAVSCYITAALLVAVNVGVSMEQSGGQSIGYGGKICYISSSSMIGFTFALPVGIIITCNLAFFLVVVYKISESTMRQGGLQSSDRYNAVIYLKLSSLTGITWIFGFLYIWTSNIVLEYIFIVLNAGQGVLIFVSFICNARIFHLYNDLFRRYGRRLRRTLCKDAEIEVNRKRKPLEIKDRKTGLTLKKSADSNKSDTSVKTQETAFRSTPLPTHLTGIDSGLFDASNIANIVNGHVTGHVVSNDMVRNVTDLEGFM